MYIDKVWPSNNAAYRCLVPEKLSLQSCSLVLPEKLVASFYRGQCHFGNLQHFTARYLAGGFCLKQGRTVSRKRLALMHIDSSRNDELAACVMIQSDQYQCAVDALSKRPLTLEILCDVHKSLDPHHHNGGRFRDVQNWIGGGSPDKAHIVPPPPEKVLGLMNDWIDYINGNEVASIEDIIVVSNQFILIHPFNDGNGRLNRAIVDALLSQNMRNQQAYVSPFLYRLAHQHEGYLDAPSAIMQGHWQRVFEFWQEALLWSTQMSDVMNAMLLQASKQLNHKLTLRQVSAHARVLIEHLGCQPIVTPGYLFSHFGWSSTTGLAVINELLEFGILSQHRVKQPHNTVIYDCHEIFDGWMKMDETLFASIK